MCIRDRSITLLNVGYKVFATIFANRFNREAKNTIGNYQCRFHKDRTTIDHICMLQQILEKFYESDILLHCVIDYKQAHSSIIRSKLYEAIEELEIPRKLTEVVKMTLQTLKCNVKIEGQLSMQFKVNKA